METCQAADIRTKADVFKSYYVVWKHVRVGRDFGDYFLFKSYYVVWKLTSINRYIFCSPSLNRTM